MTSEDQAITEQVKTYLEAICGITAENGLLAVWLANEKRISPDWNVPII